MINKAIPLLLKTMFRRNNLFFWMAMVIYMCLTGVLQIAIEQNPGTLYDKTNLYLQNSYKAFGMISMIALLFGLHTFLRSGIPLKLRSNDFKRDQILSMILIQQLVIILFFSLSFMAAVVVLTGFFSESFMRGAFEAIQQLQFSKMYLSIIFFTSIGFTLFIITRSLKLSFALFFIYYISEHYLVDYRHLNFDYLFFISLKKLVLYNDLYGLISLALMMLLGCYVFRATETKFYRDNN